MKAFKLFRPLFPPIEDRSFTQKLCTSDNAGQLKFAAGRRGELGGARPEGPGGWWRVACVSPSPVNLPTQLRAIPCKLVASSEAAGPTDPGKGHRIMARATTEAFTGFAAWPHGKNGWSSASGIAVRRTYAHFRNSRRIRGLTRTI